MVALHPIDFALPLPTRSCVGHSNGEVQLPYHTSFVHPRAFFGRTSLLKVGPTLRRLSCRVVVPLAAVVTQAAPADVSTFRAPSYPLLLVRRLSLEGLSSNSRVTGAGYQVVGPHVVSFASLL